MMASMDEVEMLERLGSGSFGEVYRVRHRVTKQELACKVIASQGCNINNVDAAIRNEVEVMRRLSSSCVHRTDHHGVDDALPILRLRGFYTHKGFCYLTMDLCRGGSLLDILRRREGGTLTEREAAAMMQRIVVGLLHCHGRRVMHQDIRPSNVLLQEPMDFSSAMLADFGLSTVMPETSVTLCGWHAAASVYIAPERRMGGPYGLEADVWGLGVLLYRVLSGGHPPDHHSSSEDLYDLNNSWRWKSISEAAKSLVRSLLCKNPAQRLPLHSVQHHPWFKTYNAFPSSH